MRLTRSACVWIATLMVTVLAATSVDAQSRGEVQSLLEEGHSLFAKNDLDGAKSKFEQALAMDITADEALQFLEKYGYHKIVAMSRDEDLGKAMARVAELVHTETRRRERDADAITQQLDAYFSTDDMEEEMRLRYTLANQYGAYLAPGLAERIGASELTVRVKAIHGFAVLSADAVMPLCALLHHEDGSTVLGAIAALKAIKNPAAIPALKRVAETGTDAEIQRAASGAIAAINPQENSKSAYELLVQQAERFYLDSRYMHLTHHDPVIWSLTDGKLGYTDVHAWALNELRAEQVLDAASDLPGDDTMAQILHTSASLAQWAEYSAVRQRAQDEASQNELRIEEPKMRSIRNRARMLSNQNIAGVLAQAMTHDRPLVAIGALEVMREVYPAGKRAASIEGPLSQALTYDHRGVRFAAAECVAYRNPSSSFANSDRVIPNLNEALVEAGGRVALTVFSDQENQNNAKEKLRASNVAAFNIAGSLDALHAAQSYPHDLIILSSKTEGMLTSDLIARLRADYRTKSVPILIVVDNSEVVAAKADYQGFADDGVQVVSYSVDPIRLRNDVINPLFESSDDARSRDIAIAGRAAEAIATLASHDAGRDTIFDLTACERSLVSVLENRSDEVRIPASRAAGILAVKAAEPLLIDIVLQGDANSVDVRVAAMDALGKINYGKGEGASAQFVEAVKAALSSEDARLEKVGAESVGSANISPAVLKN